MVAVTRALGTSNALPARPARSSPELEAKLRTARAQMADWVTCPSAKTPEGKAKIEQISTKLDSIKAEIRQTNSPSTSAPGPEAADRHATATAAEGAFGYGDAPSRVGVNLDAYA